MLLFTNRKGWGLGKKVSIDPLMKIVNMFNAEIKQYIHEDTLEIDYNRSEDSNIPKKVLSFKVSYNESGHIILQLQVEHGPFGGIKHKLETIYYDVKYINKHTIVNMLFNIMTFHSSPFYFEDGKFKKQLEYM